MKNSISILFGMVSLCTLLFGYNTAQYKHGRTLYYANGCANCHGTNAEGSSYYPRLANKEAKFLLHKLHNFKNGIAQTQKQEIMFTFAKPLSDKEIRDIVTFLTNYHKEKESRYDIEEDLLGVDY